MGWIVDVIVEGVVIVIVVVCFVVKNYIFIGMIVEGGVFDIEKYIDDVWEVLWVMVEEFEEVVVMVMVLCKCV